MKRLFVSIIILLALTGLGYAQASNCTTTTLATHTGTGQSTLSCDVGGYKQAGVQFVLGAGTFTGNLECMKDSGGAWENVTDANGTLLTVTSTESIDIAGLACRWLRSEISACAGCSVVTICFVCK